MMEGKCKKSAFQQGITRLSWHDCWVLSSVAQRVTSLPEAIENKAFFVFNQVTEHPYKPEVLQWDLKEGLSPGRDAVSGP